MRLNQFRAVVFDLDDTLYLERDYVESGFCAVSNYLRTQCHWPIREADQLINVSLELFRAGRRGDVFDVAFEHFDAQLPRPPIPELVRVYRAHRPCIQLQPDALELLGELRRHPHVWIITDGPLASQQAKATALQLSRYVRGIIYTDQWGRDFWKPHPRAAYLIQHVANSRPEDCIYLADNPKKDFVAPRQLGWAAVRIRRAGGLHTRRESPNGGEPDAELTSLAPLCQNFDLRRASQAA